MSYCDDDPWAEMEALEDERRGVDFEMAEMDREANEIHAQVAVYERTKNPADCPHAYGQWGYIDPPFYPEQEGLEPGQARCFTCRTVIPDPFADR